MKHASIINTRGQADDHAFPNDALQEIRWRSRGGSWSRGGGSVVGWRGRDVVFHSAG